MHTNMVGATEPQIKAVVPTGAGGFWSDFIMEITLLPAANLLPAVLSTTSELDFMNPVLHMAQASFEPCEPFSTMPRLALDPLPGHPVRSIYEPIAPGDSYFPAVLYDAVALAYHHPQAGTGVWPETQQALALAGLDGVQDYPVSQNTHALDGTAYTGVLVQFEGDSWSDPHTIFSQLDEVKHQFGCLFETLHKTSVAAVPAPCAMGAPCNGL